MLQSLIPAPLELLMAAAAGWLLTYAAHSTLLLGGAWLLDGRTRSTRSPGARSALWKAAAFGAVATATVQAVSGHGPGLDLAVSQGEKIVARLEAGAEGGAARREPARTAHPAPARTAGARPAPEGARTPPATGGRSAGGRRPAGAWSAPDHGGPAAWLRGAGHDWPFLLVLAWAAVAVGVVGVRVRRWRAWLDGLGPREEVDDGPIRAALDELGDDARPGAEIRLSVSRSLAGPVALPGGEICVPAWIAAELGERERVAVVAHELAHVARRDAAVLASLALLEAVFFFQPLVRLARRRTAAAAEELSDDWVRRRGLGPELAESLVTVAGRMRAGRRRAGAAGLAAEPDLHGRVRRLLRGGATGGGWRAAAAAALLAAATLAGGPRISVVPTVHAAHPGDAGAWPAGARAGARHVARPAGPEAAAAAPGGEERRLRSRASALAEGPGRALHLRISDVEGPVRLVLRPGGGRARLHLPGGRSVTAGDGPDPGEGKALLTVMWVEKGPSGAYELHLPRDVRRMAVEVDGRFLADARSVSGGDLPRIVVPAR